MIDVGCSQVVSGRCSLNVRLLVAYCADERGQTHRQKTHRLTERQTGREIYRQTG